MNILFTFYSLRPILNIHTALQINHLSILPDFRLLREEGCRAGNFLLSLQWFTPHQFHFSIFETPQRPQAGCTLKKRPAWKGLTNRYLSHRPCRGTTLPLDGSSTALNTTLSADFDSIWTSVSVWKGGSMLKRITQNSPMRCSVTPCQFFSSIHPSFVPSFARSSFHLPVCAYLCLFLPLSRQYCPSAARFPHPSPFALYQPPITISILYLG